MEVIDLASTERESDEKVNSMDPEATLIIEKIKKNLRKTFHDLGLSITETRQDSFQILIAGFTDLEFREIKKIILPSRPLFKDCQIFPHSKTNTIGMTLSCYTQVNKGKKPVLHRVFSDKLPLQNFEKILKNTTLNDEERKTAQEIIQQFSFVEKYSTGNIMATVQDDTDYYQVIFSHVERMSCSFMSAFLEFFKNLNIKIIAKHDAKRPFEVYIRVFREVARESKKRNGRSEEDENQDVISNKKRK